MDLSQEGKRIRTIILYTYEVDMGNVLTPVGMPSEE